MGVTLTFGNGAGEGLKSYLDFVSNLTQEDAGGGTTQYFGNDGRLLDTTLMTTATNGTFSNEIDFGHLVVGANRDYGLALEATLVGTVKGVAAGEVLYNLVTQAHATEARLEAALLAGNDTIYGQEQGDNVIDAKAGNDVIYGGQQTNYLSGNSGDDTIIGGKYQNILLGGNGNDKLVAAGVYDQLFGGNGNDQLTSGPGNDVLDGGSGDDVFVFKDAVAGKPGGWGDDQIVRFGDGDKLDFSGASGIHSMSDLTITQDGRRFYISDGAAGDVIEIEYKNGKAPLQDSDFIFASSEATPDKSAHSDAHLAFATALHALDPLGIA